MEAMEDPNGIPNTELGLEDDEDEAGFVDPCRLCLVLLSLENEGVDTTRRSSSGLDESPGVLKMCPSSSRSFLILTLPPYPSPCRSVSLRFLLDPEDDRVSGSSSVGWRLVIVPDEIDL